MEHNYIIDTDVCIDFLRGEEYAISLLKNLLLSQEYYELLKGAFSKKHIQAVKDFVQGFTILSVDTEISEIGAKFYRDYRKKGITLSTVDCLIMATAKKHKLRIITRNVKHYPEVELLSDFSKKLIKN